MRRLNRDREEVKKVEETWPTTQREWDDYFEPRWKAWIKRGRSGQFCAKHKTEMKIEYDKKRPHREKHFLTCSKCKDKTQMIYLDSYNKKIVIEAYTRWKKEEDLKDTKVDITQEFKAVVESFIKDDLQYSRLAFTGLWRAGINISNLEGRC